MARGKEGKNHERERRDDEEVPETTERENGGESTVEMMEEVTASEKEGGTMRETRKMAREKTKG